MWRWLRRRSREASRVQRGPVSCSTLLGGGPCEANDEFWKTEAARVSLFATAQVWLESACNQAPANAETRRRPH